MDPMLFIIGLGVVLLLFASRPHPPAQPPIIIVHPSPQPAGFGCVGPIVLSIIIIVMMATFLSS